eukprot:752121-Hanusia_phi.AAC.5
MKATADGARLSLMPLVGRKFERLTWGMFACDSLLPVRFIPISRLINTLKHVYQVESARNLRSYPTSGQDLHLVQALLLSAPAPDPDIALSLPAKAWPSPYRAAASTAAMALDVTPPHQADAPQTTTLPTESGVTRDERRGGHLTTPGLSTGKGPGPLRTIYKPRGGVVPYPLL